MAKIVRSTQKIFGANAAQNQVTEFGSIKAGGAVYSKNVNDIQTEAFEGGWSDALQDDYAPYRQDRNALDFVMTSQLAYLFQEGIPEWDSGTTYYKGAIVKVVASNGAAQLYVSLADNNTYTFTNTSYWNKILDTSVPFAKDADVVKLSGNQTIGDTKTFLSAPKLNYATANTVAIIGANKELTHTTGVTSTELGYLDGVTGNIQTQLNGKTTASVIDNKINTMLSTLYPVGSVYMGTQSTCPLATLISGSSWTKIASNIVIDVNTNAPVKGTDKAITLTTGDYEVGLRMVNTNGMFEGTPNINVGDSSSTPSGVGSHINKALGLTKNATNSGMTATVTRTNLTVNIWKRTV